jgi:hypothetical protein
MIKSKLASVEKTLLMILIARGLAEVLEISHFHPLQDISYSEIP